MKSKRLSRLAELRRRIRDRQSAVVAEAQRHVVNGQQRCALAHTARAAFASEEQAHLQTMTTVDQVWIFEEERARHHAWIEAAETDLEALQVTAASACADLQACAKDLKVSELVLERVQQQRLQQEAKHEQRLADDLVGARMGGRS